jgi:glutaredoxin
MCNNLFMKKILLILTASLLVLASCGKQNTTDIINPNAQYRYFFGATCPHCQELNRIAEEKNLYSQISIEKREVYHNSENQAMFLELIEELDVEGSGVPFVYDTVTGEVAVGVKPALELMTSRLGQVPPVINEQKFMEEKETQAEESIEELTPNTDSE